MLATFHVLGYRHNCISEGCKGRKMVVYSNVNIQSNGNVALGVGEVVIFESAASSPYTSLQKLATDLSSRLGNSKVFASNPQLT